MIDEYCKTVSAVKKRHNQEIEELRDTFLKEYVHKNLVSPGDKIYDESNLPFVVKTIRLIESSTVGVALEILGHRVLKSGHVSKSGFVKLLSHYSLTGECWKNPIKAVKND